MLRNLVGSNATMNMGCVHLKVFVAELYRQFDAHMRGERSVAMGYVFVCGYGQSTLIKFICAGTRCRV